MYVDNISRPCLFVLKRLLKDVDFTMSYRVQAMSMEKML
jgi:hypothetical protein